MFTDDSDRRVGNNTVRRSGPPAGPVWFCGSFHVTQIHKRAMLARKPCSLHVPRWSLSLHPTHCLYSNLHLRGALERFALPLVYARFASVRVRHTQI